MRVRSPKETPSGIQYEALVLLQASPWLRMWSRVVVRSDPTDVAARGYLPSPEGKSKSEMTSTLFSPKLSQERE